MSSLLELRKYGPERVPMAGAQLIDALESAWHDIRCVYPDWRDVLFVLAKGERKDEVTWGEHRGKMWWGPQGDTPQMMISGEALHSGPELVLETLLHEGCHDVAYTRQIKDAPKNYHTVDFLAIAEQHGLEFIEDAPSPSRGYSAVTLRAETIELFQPTLDDLYQGIQFTIPYGAVGFEPVTRPDRFTAVCQCHPPRELQTDSKFFEVGDVVCGLCCEPFAYDAEYDRPNMYHNPQPGYTWTT